MEHKIELLQICNDKPKIFAVSCCSKLNKEHENRIKFNKKYGFNQGRAMAPLHNPPMAFYPTQKPIQNNVNSGKAVGGA